MKVDAAFEELAKTAFFNGLKSSDLPPVGYEYRKGQTFADVKQAVHAGMNDCAGKFEHEMEAVATRFAAVFKKAKEGI